MPRKKKEVTEKVFVPSKYQEAIFDFVKNGHGNAVIEAVAGSGKTTTAIKCVELMGDDSKILMTAFNTDIVDELKKKIKVLPNKNNVDCRTMHSLGYMLLMSNFPRQIDPKPNDFKYVGYIYNNIVELSDGYYYTMKPKDRKKYMENIRELVNFGRYYLCESIADLNFIEHHYNIPVYNNEKEVALKIMKWGKENISTIDFTDMVWLPNVLNCKPYGKLYDWIVCDECQDTMTAERMLLLRCTKMSTRMLFFGEKIQCIYSFMGSDYRSFDELRKLPNTVSLPLSITYRCSKNVVGFVKKFNNRMEPRDDAPEGIIVNDAKIEDIQDGDMVLCRTNAPLLKLYCELSKIGKASYIRGKDIGTNLIKIIKSTKHENLEIGLKKKGVFPELYNDLLDEIDTVMSKHHITMEMAMDDVEVTKKYDIIQALDAISKNITTADELIERVSSLFSDSKKKGISLSTIHKAKGLESENVFICCPSLMPAKSAKEEWELEAEKNLEYVAYTRAKNKLLFLDEKEFGAFSSNSQERTTEVEKVMYKIFALYGGNERCIVSKPSHEAALSIIRNSSGITEPDGKIIDINSKKKTKSRYSRQIVIPRKKKRKI